MSDPALGTAGCPPMTVATGTGSINLVRVEITGYTFTPVFPLVTGLGDIAARELATFPVGGPDSKIHLRVGRYGPYVEEVAGPDEDGTRVGRRANVPEDLPPPDPAPDQES